MRPSVEAYTACDLHDRPLPFGRRACRWLPLAPALLAATLAVQRADAPRRTSSNLAALLEAYTAWAEGGPAAVIPATDLTDAPYELGRIAPAFASADSAGETERQRRVVAAFALELAAAGATKDADAAARLVEWACAVLRRRSGVDEFERAWHLAALAVLEGGINPPALHRHLEHADARLTDRAVLLLARAIAEEQSTAPSEIRLDAIPAARAPARPVPAVQIEAERIRRAERAIERFAEAAAYDSVRAEAQLRMGHVQLGLQRFDQALQSWAPVDREATEPALIYLVRLFRGLAFEGLGRDADASAAYLHALEISPGAHSGVMRLAVLAFRRGQKADSERLVAALLGDADPRRDPWWSYYSGDWRLWYPRIAVVRRLLRLETGDARP